jgi:crossover junction endodeoxyribonuclease RuvC
MALRILGLDPGSRFTGYGIVEQQGSRLTVVTHGRIELGRIDQMVDRLATLHQALETLIGIHRPTAVALEALFHGPNVRSLIVLAQARGVLLAAVGRAGLPVREYAPSEIKSAVTGSGRADKEQVGKMVRLILGLRGALAVDASDALAAAICLSSRAALENLVAGPARSAIPKIVDDP